MKQQEIGGPTLVKIHCAHPHRIANYDDRGVQTTGGAVVLVLSEFCPGGSLQEHLNLLLAMPSSAKTPVDIRIGFCKDTVFRRNNAEKKIDDSSDSNANDSAVVEPKSRRIHTPISKTVLSEAEDVPSQNVKNSDVGGTRFNSKAGRGPELDGGAKIVMARTGMNFPTRRMETWVRQVRRFWYR